MSKYFANVAPRNEQPTANNNVLQTLAQAHAQSHQTHSFSAHTPQPSQIQESCFDKMRVEQIKKGYSFRVNALKKRVAKISPNNTSPVVLDIGFMTANDQQSVVDLLTEKGYNVSDHSVNMTRAHERAEKVKQLPFIQNLKNAEANASTNNARFGNLFKQRQIAIQ